MTKLVWQTVTIALALGFTTPRALAQSADPQAIAAAQALVDEASDLMDAKKFAAACPKLEQATKLVPEGVGARLALAECYEGDGRLASAQGQYLQAEALAQKGKDARRAKEASKEAARLKPKLATITLSVANGVNAIEGVRLTWDGFVWEPALWGTPIPVDVGKHEIELNAPGRKPWKAEVTIQANGAASKQDVPMLEELPPEPEKPLPPPVTTQPTTTSRTPLIVSGVALGAIGIGIGVGFTLAAASKDKELAILADEIRVTRANNETLCPAANQDPRCAALVAGEGRRDVLSGVGIAGFVVGGIATVGTVILALTGQTKRGAAPNHAIVVVPSRNGIMVSGTF